MNQPTAKKSNQKNILFLSLLFVLFGFLLMVSINTKRASQVEEDKRNADLVAHIENMEQENSTLEEQIAAVRSEIDSIRDEQSTGASESAQLSQALSLLNQYAGLTKLSGSGLLITLDDNTAAAELARKNSSTYLANKYIVHDYHLRYLVRAVAEHSEAIAINGIRVVDTTSIRCVGTVIMVNANRLAPPYTITIIGDSEQLYETLLASGSYFEVNITQILMTVSKEASLTVPAYSGTYKPVYASLSTSLAATQ